MESIDLLCSRNARAQKDGRGAASPSFLLAVRAVKDSLAAPFKAKWENWKVLARANGTLGVPVGGRVRKLRALGDQSDLIPER